MVDDRIQVKFERERGTETLNRIKALTILNHGKLYGKFADTILNLLNFACDVIEKDPTGMLIAHTHQNENAKKRQQLIEITQFVTNFEEFFLSQARAYDVLEQKIKSFFGINDQRPVRAKIKDICEKLRLGILRLPCGSRVVLPMDGDAYKILERFDVKYPGRKPAPRDQEKLYIKVVKRDAGMSLDKKKKEVAADPVDFGSDQGMAFLEGLSK